MVLNEELCVCSLRCFPEILRDQVNNCQPHGRPESELALSEVAEGQFRQYGEGH